MEHFIIGTAGHIDHGKTALIGALTGRDTDTMKEEKQRGISIDLGFTWFQMENGEKAGIIDVPGHEKFLPNMLSGVCGMDLVLLVIALDDGIMPQTREHMDILESLKISQGIVVLTKLDKVEPEWADMMKEEIKEELAGTVFAGWDMVCVSSATGEGIDALRQKITALSAHLERSRSTAGRFRLPVDRVLSPKGLGTVVAGTLMEGVVHADDEVMLYPARIVSRIKSLQVHGENVRMAYAGQRTAMLLSGVKKEDVARGVVAAEPDSLQPSDRFDVKVTLHRDCARTVKDGSRLHLHIGTAQTVCRIVFFGKSELHAGESVYAQLVLEHPLTAKKWDCFVLRYLSPQETVGGGVVLDACAVRHRKKEVRIAEYFSHLENDRLDRVLEKWIAEAGHFPVAVPKLLERLLTGGFLQDGEAAPSERLDACLAAMAAEKSCVLLHGRKQDCCLSYEAAEQMGQKIAEWLETYHAAHPYRMGASKLELKNACAKEWKPEPFDAFLAYLIGQGCLACVSEGQLYALASFEIAETPKLRQQLCSLAEAFGAAGFDFVDCKTQKPDDEPEELFREKLAFWAEKGALVAISDDFYTTPEVAERIREKVLAYFKANEILSFAGLRDLLGSSRRSAKPLMAWLDKEKITAWCGKETERKFAGL